MQSHAPGYKKFSIKPSPGGGLTQAQGSLETYYGTITSAWEYKENELIQKITIPPISSEYTCYRKTSPK